jgi:hypothetical protein
MDPYETLDPAFWVPGSHLSPSASAAWVILVGVVGLGGLLLLAITRIGVHRARAQAAQAAQADASRVAPGHTVLRGTIEADGDAEPVITVAVHQTGRSTCGWPPASGCGSSPSATSTSSSRSTGPSAPRRARACDAR